MSNSLRCKIKHLCHNGTLTERERDRILKALELIPDNATNGDVIKALFPDAGQPHFYGVKNGCFDADWWNAPYKAESEVEK